MTSTSQGVFKKQSGLAKEEEDDTTCCGGSKGGADVKKNGGGEIMYGGVGTLIVRVVQARNLPAATGGGFFSTGSSNPFCVLEFEVCAFDVEDCMLHFDSITTVVRGHPNRPLPLLTALIIWHGLLNGRAGPVAHDVGDQPEPGPGVATRTVLLRGQGTCICIRNATCGYTHTCMCLEVGVVDIWGPHMRWHEARHRRSRHTMRPCTSHSVPPPSHCVLTSPSLPARCPPSTPSRRRPRASRWPLRRVARAGPWGPCPAAGSAARSPTCTSD